MDKQCSSIEIKHIQRKLQLGDQTLEVLQDISLDINQGEFISMVGESGCGKSTLLRILAGLDSATDGEVTINGKAVDAPSLEIGVLFQESRLLPWYTVEKNIAFGISSSMASKMSAKERKEYVKEYIALVGLNGFEKALPSQLSGGMQKRVSLARVLVNKPKTLLLDEPFGSLDAFTKIYMQQEIHRIWQQERMTVLLVTHDIDEAIYLGDRVVVMSPKPSTIQNIIPVELSRPRDRADNEDFAAIRKKVYSEFFEIERKQAEFFI